MFEHPNFVKCAFEEIPLNRDCHLVEDTYLKNVNSSLVKCFEKQEWDVDWYVSFVAARRIGVASVELSWFADVNRRFHQFTISLPREAFVACVCVRRFDFKPFIFAKREWIQALHRRRFAAFAMIDAIGVKKALEEGRLTRERLLQLRAALDGISAKHPNVAFVSVSDTIILKGSWSVGYLDEEAKYEYEPEALIGIVAEIREAYQRIADLPVYAILTQGSNEFFDDSLLHISDAKNHVGLNSLGIPYAELFGIDAIAKTNMKAGKHKASELYIDSKFLHSLSLKFGFDRERLERGTHDSAMAGGQESFYYCSSIDEITANFRSPDET